MPPRLRHSTSLHLPAPSSASYLPDLSMRRVAAPEACLCWQAEWELAVHARDVDPHGALLLVAYLPPLNDDAQGRGVQVVVLVSALTARDDQTCRLQHGEVLGDRLTRGAEPVFGRQPDAQLEESLAAAFLQLIENDASRRIGKSLEHIAHWLTISKSLLACQGRLGREGRG